MGFSIAVTLGWCLALLVHLNTLRRTALSTTRDILISNIYDLRNLGDNEEKCIDELYFDHKTVRIERKIAELNTIYHGKLLSLSDEAIKKIITFDIEQVDSNENLKLACYEAVEHIDEKYHKNIHNNWSFIFINRFEIIFVLILVTIALFYWFLGGNV